MKDDEQEIFLWRWEYGNAKALIVHSTTSIVALQLHLFLGTSWACLLLLAEVVGRGEVGKGARCQEYPRMEKGR